MTQKQIDILKSIEQEFNRINAQEVVDTNDLIAQIENRVDSKRKLRLELEAVDKINKSAVNDIKRRITQKLLPIAVKYGFKLEDNYNDAYIALRVKCCGYKLGDGSERTIDGYLRYTWKSEDGIAYTPSPIPMFETKYRTDYVTSEDALINHYIDGIVNALKTKV
jgi:hypothetical protein